jgi:hypothetical protein
MSEINGILDNSTQQVVVLQDDRVILRGNVTIHGVLDVGLVRTTEIISDARYEKKFLTFVAPEGTQLAGTGLLWQDKTQNKQLVYRVNPDCFFLSEHIDIPTEKAYLIGGMPTLTFDELGASVTKSNLRKIGTLDSLRVAGNVNFGDFVFSSRDRFSVGREDGDAVFSVYDNLNDVQIILEGNEDGHAKIGTYNNKAVDIIVGDQTRLTIGVNGNIILGRESNTTTLVNVYGRLGVNVKNPKEEFEVAGNIKFQNKLFAVGDSPPIEGTFQKGDIVWNSDPMNSNYIGWVCTAAGSPGLWNPFGQIVG